MIAPDAVVERAPDAVAEQVGEEVVVWLGTDRSLHLLDPSGALVWWHLDRPATAAEIARLVSDQVGTGADEVRQQVLDFLAEMVERSLLVAS